MKTIENLFYACGHWLLIGKSSEKFMNWLLVVAIVGTIVAQAVNYIILH